MNKKTQAFLDIETKNEHGWIQEQIILSHSKTELNALLRALKKLDKALYKTWAKETPFNEIQAIANISLILISDELPEGQ